MLRLTYTDYTALRVHGEDSYPDECCGILLGKADGESSNEVRVLMRAGNTRVDSAHNRYHISPVELIQAQRVGRESGLDIIGFYHSHPDHAAEWSPTDFAEAHWLGCSYVITAVEQGKATITNSFQLMGPSEDEKSFVHETIEISVTGVAGKISGT